MSKMDIIKQTYFQECEEQLVELESGLVMLERSEHDADTVNAVFRAVHSIKGGAGAFSLDDLVHFAHAFETVLDSLRTDKLEPLPHVMKTMLRAADVLGDLVRCARQDMACDEAQCSTMKAELEALLGASVDGESLEEARYEFLPVSVNLSTLIGGENVTAAHRQFTIKYSASKALYAKGNETATLFRQLNALGEMTVSCDWSGLPLLDEIDPEEAYLSWTIEIATDHDEAALRSVFDFAEGDCALDFVERSGADSPDDAQTLEALLSMVLNQTEEPLPDQTVAGPAQNAVRQPRIPDAASGAASTAQGGVQPTIRVDLERVDLLIDLVGELVIHQSMLAQNVSEAGFQRTSKLAMGLEQLEHLSREIQDSVMAIRAQPVKPVFQRMARVAREVAQMTGKSVRLITEGDGTEIDKTVIEKLSDPLTHMIRNAIDHGLEKPEDRIKAGKAEEGVVRLSAAHRSGRVIIEVADDGGGINRKRVKSIALARNLIDDHETLSDHDIDNLIFLPGFSTVAEVSDVSGRGVGMDVVRRSIQSLGGRISISSRPGIGSTFSLSLPLTLAVLDGMVVTVAGQTLIIPLTVIVETRQPRPEIIYGFGGEARVISIRDSFTPLVDVGRELGYRSEISDPSTGVVILVETEGNERFALLVDAIQGQRQVVIKSLESNYERVRGIAAATILGDGRVALIIDIDGIISTARADGPKIEPTLIAAE